jgi:hypothetical protein
MLFFRTSVIWFLIGISLGMYMGISGNYVLIAAHTHINLLGWVSSALFGVFYAIASGVATGRWPVAHYVVYNAGLLLFMPGLYFEGLGVSGLEPAVSVGASLVCLGVLIFVGRVFSAARNPSA